MFRELSETNFMQLQFHTVILHIEVVQSTMSTLVAITENENLKFHNFKIMKAVVNAYSEKNGLNLLRQKH